MENVSGEPYAAASNGEQWWASYGHDSCELQMKNCSNELQTENNCDGFQEDNVSGRQ